MGDHFSRIFLCRVRLVAALRQTRLVEPRENVIDRLPLKIKLHLVWISHKTGQLVGPHRQIAEPELCWIETETFASRFSKLTDADTSACAQIADPAWAALR